MMEISPYLEQVYSLYREMIRANYRKYGYLTPRMRKKIFIKAVEAVSATNGLENEHLIVEFEEDDLKHNFFHTSE